MEQGWLPETHISGFGLVPKCHQAGKWKQIVVDQSQPEGQSVNNGFEPELFTLCHMRFDEGMCSRVSDASGKF